MDASFARYLLSKQTVDDRALNKDVVNALRAQLPPQPRRVIDVGAGIGTMLKRMVTWDLLRTGEYVLVDAMHENIAYAQTWLPDWAAQAGLRLEHIATDRFQLCGGGRDIHVQLERADVFEFIRRNPAPADLLIAHAFLDLLPMPESLQRLLQLTGGLAWLTINFDGVSTFQPEIEPALEEKIEHLYHRSMDRRPSGGGSRTGRKLFEHLGALSIEILAAGASDWIVHATRGAYPADEKYFLQFILGFFEESLKDCEELEQEAFRRWLARRREQVESGELVYIAHQIDFLIRKEM